MDEAPSVAPTQEDLPDGLEIEEELAQCPICSDGLLMGNSTAALACGHLFHRECIVSWLLRSGSRGVNPCPICKKVTPLTDVRDLHFDIEQIEIDRDAVNIPGLDEEAAAACRWGRRELAAIERELSEREESAQAKFASAAQMKEQRKLLQQQTLEEQENAGEYKRRLEVSAVKAAQLRASVDELVAQRTRRNQVERPSEEDQDVKEERREIARSRMDARAEFLHKGLVGLKKQENEIMKSRSELQESIKTLEGQIQTRQQELDRIRKERKQVDDRRPPAETSLSMIRTPGPPKELVKQVKVAVVTPATCRLCTPDEEDWDPMSRTSTRVRPLGDVSNLGLGSQDGGSKKPTWGGMLGKKSSDSLTTKLGRPAPPRAQEVLANRVPKMQKIFDDRR
mmetsp:Transcript_72490/g.172814  ORF Transcript_72490/g.172814 Transcript_72490/m.172814 type:complete len:396 (-) Transcript_72490:118-1305(-)